ncbi:MAG: hypothetical protein NC452_05825 [Eubacterium sp.]|nr:hypothetical protein [Eubacterium sp.]
MANKVGRPKNPEREYIRGKYTPDSGKAARKYMKNNYYTVQFKRKDKPLIKAASEKKGVSMTAFIYDSVHKEIAETLTEEEILKVMYDDGDEEQSEE